MSTRCEVHGQALVPGEAEVVYGIWTGDGFEETRRRLFPQAHSHIACGCFYSAEFPRTGAVLMCPACREAEADWMSFFSPAGG
ncbi:MAG: hypothetical protein P4L83_08150 [Nevskia sp.]|nr:hypothetical protein [Nevskia sp.]